MKINYLAFIALIAIINITTCEVTGGHYNMSTDGTL